jgi:hypothetical protein
MFARQIQKKSRTAMVGIMPGSGFFMGIWPGEIWLNVSILIVSNRSKILH